ncbi:MAG: pentapeptide repeat-containing protein [Pirellulaceae bacterium]|nr:pentapeptide repeat-containing protein [Pirellulaceae bacterium]
MLEDSGRVEEKDKKVTTDIVGEDLQNRQFTRLVAKARRFERVSFNYSTFDAAYLRSCVFDSCTFVGCRFVSSNLHGSTFTGCKFDYATFERTIVDFDDIVNNAPSVENLQLRFARTLRTNFQALGDAVAVNKAIALELKATEVHLRKSWWSNESYYRHKYKGFPRVIAFARWIEFTLLDFLWGNGESTFKLCRSLGLLILFVAIVDLLVTGQISIGPDYFGAILKSPQLLLGTLSPDYYSKGYLAFIVFLRLIAIALFLSVIIKRFNRR